MGAEIGSRQKVASARRPKALSRVLGLLGASFAVVGYYSSQLRRRFPRRPTGLIAVVNGPTDVTLRPGDYFPEDPRNRLLATLSAAEEFEVLASEADTFHGSRPRFHLIRLASGEEGYLEEGHFDSRDRYSRFHDGVEQRGGRLAHTAIRRAEPQKKS